ncbi:MAG TPA: DUF86 domain-containing protein [Epsilonproteobacteria bacterium]|nr:DUF86 domain-containing protein [Campylobacterota bacterium]
MSKDLLALKTIIESIEKINLYSSPNHNADDFYHDTKSFDATMIHFINIGEMIDRISLQLKENYPSIPWREIKDFRNLVSHNYFGIDADELWDIITNHLPKLKTQINTIIQNTEEQ